MNIFPKKRFRSDSSLGEFHQSGSYHRYFEGWAEYETLSAKGKVKINRVYVSDYYCVDLPCRTWNIMRCVLWAATILSIAFFIIGSVQNTMQNRNQLLAVLQVIAASGYVAMFFALGSLRTKMTVHEFKSGPRALKKSSTVTAITNALCFAVTVAVSAVQKISLTGKSEMTSMFCFAVSALILSTISLAAHRLPIAIKENENAVPDGSVIIRKPGE